MARVLVVEDDAAIHRMLHDALRAEGFDVLSVTEGEGAVRAFQENSVDAIVLDVLLPGLSGFQVAERVRNMAKGKATPILMLSGIYRGGRQRTKAAERFGLLAYVEKPFRMEQILGPLRGVLHSSSVGAVVVEPPAPRTVGPEEARILMRGNLKDRALPWILGELLRRRATGALMMRRGRMRRMIWLRDGTPIVARSNLRSERIGALLLEENLVSPDDWQVIRERMRSSAQRLTRLVVDLGLITQQTMDFVIQRQFRRRFAAPLSWDQGEYLFRTGGRHPPTPQVIEAGPVLVFAAIREGMDNTQIGRELSPVADKRPAAAPGPLIDQFAGAERRYLASLDGERSVRQIVAERAFPDVAALMLTAMCVGAVVPVEMLRGGAGSPGPSAGAGAPPVASAEPASERPSQPPSSRAMRSAPTSLAPPSSPQEFELQKQLELLQGKSHYEILGLRQNANDRQVRLAFHKLAKDYHPDRYVTAAAALRDRADRIFAHIAGAYQVLSSPDDRGRYDLELNSGSSASEASEKVARVLNAEKRFTEGELALRRRQFPQALRLFQEAVELYSEEAEYHAFLGHALALCRPKDLEVRRKAFEEIAEAKRLSPRCVKAHLFEGYLHKSAGDMRRAETAFRAVLEYEPSHVDAQRELRLISMRRKG